MMLTKTGLQLDVDVALASLDASLFRAPPETYLATTRRALEAARALVSDIKSRTLSASETLSLYDDISLLIGDASSIASVMRNAHPDRPMRDAADTAEQEIETFSTELQLDRGIYDALVRAQAAVAADASALDAAGKHLLDKIAKDMRRSGVDRDEKARAEVRRIRDELVLIGQEFGKNIVEDVQVVEIDPGQLDGLPADFVAAHPPGDNGKVKITSDNTDYVPFITYAKSATAREAVWRAYRKRANPVNLPVLDRLLRRRHELAQLLGYPSYAAYATEDKMIGTAEKAAAFIEQTAQASGSRAAADYAQLLSRKRLEPGAAAATEVDPWDAPYLSDRVSEEQTGFSSQAVRPYLEFSRVEDGVLAIMARLFDVHFVQASDAEAASARWHSSVRVLDVYDGPLEAKTGRALGRIYLDMHPREGKYKHYAQFTVRSGVNRPGRERLPEGALICNFPDPHKGLALLELDQVRTFFHEFGHLMHHILGGQTPWAGVSGVATEWDFVEAPSQLLEEWAWDFGTLASFAKHHQTGEALPQKLLDQARAADQLGKGLWVRQQMFYAALSLEFHRRDPATFDTTRLLAELQAQYTPYRFIEGTAFHASFGHLNGYSAVYYTYMWSLVIAKDLFSAFRTAGLFDAKKARSYRDEVLVPGGSRPAAELCQRFLGRPYDVAAYRDWLEGR